MWRLHHARLWPVRFSAPRPWPLGDALALCEAGAADPAAALHRGPAPSGDCGCGLYAYHDFANLEHVGVDVWGAVLACGDVEVHADGFRSEWQLIVLSEPPVGHGARTDELAQAADRHGALLAPLNRPSTGWRPPLVSKRAQALLLAGAGEANAR